ncbi:MULTISPECIES: T4 family baseplate hub assembly chaperone [Mycobacterium]|uniref:Phage baseplate protein n=1 Tax=Mycobacterium kiyosense TaxID=2871094 RepID=A0A9P3UYG6_9MYCO|nr:MULTISPECIES: hypothetical protein [Mycobacterium]BDB45517.1 hypothetical protein IWGMT90018_59630 [Mycobacterium kiyosense]BDE11147.1 hypothetical protein MKCMC460_00070 [Mycobacterium sp. 20KCMC460]GLB83525.1 hypothetical protein SRL2020028_27810 [Mycobacterium kiyosense]GLB91398.1 hypothetical protein SRL2020130_42150 [Mycobacterium kiyosense]GLB97548.1 hypothetical protein SRL2020226_43240 [Mycobacterium kiyosense]
METSAARLLQAWEVGAAVAPLDRAPSLLRTLDALPASVPVDELTVGQCDARLFELRRTVFGETLDAVTTCPACQTEVELNLPLGELQPTGKHSATSTTVHADGYTLRCRIPRNADLRALDLLHGRATPRDLLDRCLLEAASPAGDPVAAHQLPDATVATVVEALADSDPGACIALRVSCTCGNQWLDELDIRSVLWNDLTEWVGRMLSEVHRLAQAYGWSETEILAMSGWRRRWYLEALGW